MIRVTVTPRTNDNLYGLLVAKEIDLRRKNAGTLHRSGAKTKNRARWSHTTYKGWISFERSLGGIIVAVVQSKNPGQEWRLMNSFMGFLDRHFRSSISSVHLAYGPGADEGE